MRNKVIIQVAFLLLSISGFARISPSISAVSKQSSGILFTQTDNSTVYLPCQSVSAIVQSGGSSNTITVYYANEQSSIKTLAFDYTVTGFSTKQQAVDSLYEWSSCDTSGGGGVSQTLSISGDTLSISGGNSVVLPVYVQVDSAIITSYDVLNSQNAPPGSPATGDTYLVGNSPSGAWVGHAKDVAEWNGSAWVFTDGVQGDFLYNATTALTYIFRSGNWVQTTGIPALNKGNTISTGLTIGTRNNKDFNFISNNILRGGMLANGSFKVANQGGSGNVLVGADSLGVQRKLYIGDGLSLSNDSLLASGGGGSFIPLSGTVSGSPVTGDIEMGGAGGRQIYGGDLMGDYISFVVNQADYILSLISSIGGINSAFEFSNDNIGISFDNASSRGIIGRQDYTANITDLDYTQKKYVDTHIAFTTVPSSSSDTGTKGQMAIDATYLYVCVNTNTWVRTLLVTW